MRPEGPGGGDGPLGAPHHGGMERKRMNSASPASQPTGWLAASLWEGGERHRGDSWTRGSEMGLRLPGDVCVSGRLRTRRPGFESLLCSPLAEALSGHPPPHTLTQAVSVKYSIY